MHWKFEFLCFSMKDQFITYDINHWNYTRWITHGSEVEKFVVNTCAVQKWQVDRQAPRMPISYVKYMQVKLDLNNKHFTRMREYFYCTFLHFLTFFMNIEISTFSVLGDPLSLLNLNVWSTNFSTDLLWVMPQRV